MSALAAIVEAGPDPAVDGVVRWRRVDLKRVIEERFKVIHSERSVSALLRVLSFSFIGGRPQHPAQDRPVLEAFEKTSRARSQRTEAICPRRCRSRSASKMKPGWDRKTAARASGPGPAPAHACRPTGATRMPVSLEPSARVAAPLPLSCCRRPTPRPCRCTSTRSVATSPTSRAKGAHAVVLMGRAGWHSTDKLKRPKNIAIILLPSRSPELNPVENIWQDLRQDWPSNPVFDTYEDIIDAGCEASNKLLAQPQTITSIGSRKWALRGQ